MKFLQKAVHLRDDTSGTIIVQFALIVSLLIILVGGVIDISNMLSAKSKTQDLSDAAALMAAGSSRTVSGMKKTGEAYIKSYKDNNTSRFMLTDYKVTPTVIDGKRTVDVELTAKPEVFFLHLIGIQDVRVNSVSTVVEADSKIEIALVLDVSVSMAGNKITQLRVAANEFIDTVIGDNNTSQSTSVNIIPFGGNVNIGPALTQKFMVSNGNAIFDPADRVYRAAINDADKDVLATNGYQFTDGMNCIESIASDYNADLIPDNSRSQLPRFVNRNTVRTICPEDASSVLFNSNNKGTLKNKIQNMVLSHGTAMDVGILWGLKALSPSHQGVIGGDFPSRPDNFNGKNKKIIVIMTDGNITGQSRPRRVNDPDRVSSGLGNPGNRNYYPPGTTSSTSSNDDAIGRFKKGCELASENNIEVYTIGYRITAGQIADTLLESCASSPENYFFVENNDIKTAFEKIAAELSQLRISR